MALTWWSLAFGSVTSCPRECACRTKARAIAENRNDHPRIAARAAAIGATMTPTVVPRPAPVPGRPTTISGPVRQALIEALIGAVLDEREAVAVARMTPTVVKPALRRKTSAESADG